MHDDLQVTLEVRDGRFRDRQTGSTWNMFGHATAGQLEGQRLKEVQHLNTFWFAWAAFRPETTIWDG